MKEIIKEINRISLQLVLNLLEESDREALIRAFKDPKAEIILAYINK